MVTSEKVREGRLRRAAQRQGMRLLKSRRRDERAVDYGMYCLVNERNNLMFGTSSSGWMDASLDDIEEYLKQD